jgi:hypothetical protein
LKGISGDEVGRVTSDNFARLFLNDEAGEMPALRA